MQTAKSPLNYLEHPYSLRILTTIYREGKILRSILYNKLSKSITPLVRRVNELIELGLIHEELSEFAPISKTLSLTEKGKKVAERVIEIEEILMEE